MSAVVVIGMEVEVLVIGSRTFAPVPRRYVGGGYVFHQRIVATSIGLDDGYIGDVEMSDKGRVVLVLIALMIFGIASWEGTIPPWW